MHGRDCWFVLFHNETVLNWWCSIRRFCCGCVGYCSVIALQYIAINIKITSFFSILNGEFALAVVTYSQVKLGSRSRTLVCIVRYFRGCLVSSFVRWLFKLRHRDSRSGRSGASNFCFRQPMSIRHASSCTSRNFFSITVGRCSADTERVSKECTLLRITGESPASAETSKCKLVGLVRKTPRF